MSSRLFFIFLTFCMLFAAAASAATTVVEGIRLGGTAGKTRLVIDVGGKTEFRAFTLGGPWRIIVDVPTANWKISKTRMLSNGLIKGYRSGALDDSLTRIVFDLKKPAVIEEAFALPKDNFNKDRIVIDLAPASQNMFDAKEKVVFGNGNIRAAVTKAKPPVKGVPQQKPQSEFARAEGLALRQMTGVPQRKPGQQEKTVKKGKYVVVIDAGHGGADPGALGPGSTREKNITLQVARELRRQLEETGRYKVVMTRDSDVYIKLHDRVDISRRKGADVFISIHADKIGRKNVRGASIYTLSSDASDAETARLAEQENNSGMVAGVDLSGESHDVAGILLDLAMREKMNESNLLAQYVESAMRREKIRLLPNSHRSAGFAVLKAPDVPSILIETGFLSNPEEAKLLSSAQFQAKIAGSIIEGLDAYFRKIQSLQ